MYIHNPITAVCR